MREVKIYVLTTIGAGWNGNKRHHFLSKKEAIKNAIAFGEEQLEENKDFFDSENEFGGAFFINEMVVTPIGDKEHKNIAWITEKDEFERFKKQVI